MKFTVDTAAWTITPEHGPQRSWFDPEGFALLSQWWVQASWQRRYSYQFRWLGRPIIQLPADAMMMQDLIWRVRPSVIIETGVAHGGSAVLHASLLSLVWGKHSAIAPMNRPRVIAIDIDIRPDNRQAIESHPLHAFIELVEGGSTTTPVVDLVRRAVRPDDHVMVVLDSNHSRDHVLAELNAYAPLVSRGSALVVMDGVMPLLADVPGGSPAWRHDNPNAALDAFLRSPAGKSFVRDQAYAGFAITHSPSGVLLRT